MALVLFCMWSDALYLTERKPCMEDDTQMDTTLTLVRSLGGQDREMALNRSLQPRVTSLNVQLWNAVTFLTTRVRRGANRFASSFNTNSVLYTLPRTPTDYTLSHVCLNALRQISYETNDNCAFDGGKIYVMTSPAFNVIDVHDIRRIGRRLLALLGKNMIHNESSMQIVVAEPTRKNRDRLISGYSFYSG